MEPIKMPEEIVKILRTAWESQKRMMETLEGQTEKLVQMVYGHSEAFHIEGKQILKQWADMVKQSQAQYKKMMEDNLAKLDSASKKE